MRWIMNNPDGIRMAEGDDPKRIAKSVRKTGKREKWADGYGIRLSLWSWHGRWCMIAEFPSDDGDESTTVSVAKSEKDARAAFELSIRYMESMARKTGMKRGAEGL